MWKTAVVLLLAIVALIGLVQFVRAESGLVVNIAAGMVILWVMTVKV